MALIISSTLLACPPAAAEDETSGQARLDTMPFEQLVALRTVSAASKFEQLISEAPSAVVVLTAADIKAFGWRTLGDAIASLPGMYVTDDRNYSYAGARGFLRLGDYNSRFLLLIDGARTNDAVYDQAALGRDGFLDMDIVQRIEFVPGPGSAVYGSNALFGVISVITKDGSSLNRPQAALAIGSHGDRTLRASWGWHGQNGADVMLSATVHGRHGEDLYFPQFDTPEQNRGVAEHLDYERARNFIVKANYAGVTLSVMHAHRTKGVPTASFGAMFNTPNRTIDARSLVNLSATRELAAHLILSAQAVWGRADYLGTGEYPGESLPSVTNIDGDNARWYGASVQATLTALRGHKVVLGVDVEHDTRRDQFNYDLAPYRQLLDDRRTGNRRGLFIEDEIRLPSDVLLNLGVRHDIHSTGAHTTSPRAALLYKLTPSDTLKLIYGTAFRVPNAYEMYYAPIGGGIQAGNLALEPERIRTYEAVVEHALDTRGHATLSVFQYSMRDLITQQQDGATGVLMFHNLARAQASGAEAAFERLLDGGARVRASYAWQRAKDGSGASLVNSPRHLAKLNLVVPITRLGRLASEVQCMSSRLTEHARTGGHCLANLTLVRSRVLPGADLSLSVLNVTNKRYADPAGPAFVQEDLARDGRTFHAKLVYQF